MIQIGLEPVFSVCIATYHQDEYIETCVRSVLSQAHEVALEILIGDDGDSPLTPDIVQRLDAEFPGCIQYFRHPVNLGASANYQFLIARARGEFIAHLDGDDFWLPGKLAAQLKVLREQPDIAACYTNALVVEDDLSLRMLFSAVKLKRFDLAFMLAGGNFLNHSSMTYRSQYKDVLLGFEGPFIDYKMHLHLARKGDLVMLPGAFVAYRWATPQSMVQRTPGKVQQWYWEAMLSVLQCPEVSREARCDALAHYWGMAVSEFLIKGRWAWMQHWSKEMSAVFPVEFRQIYWWGWRFAAARLIRFSLAALGRNVAAPLVRVLHPR
jgi:glycosyltransferase involved in cell wall biosynthesis